MSRWLLAFACTPGVAWASDGTHAGPLSLAAPLVAIMLALITHRVVPSLAAGVVVASLVASQGAPLGALTDILEHVRGAVWDWDHLRISVFAAAVAALVGLLHEAGATRALVGRVERLAQGPRGAMVSSWLAGTIVFFDDYANCLVVGGAMGPLYDRFRVSRAKLAYVVDATAAPVASLALVSTWIGYEVGLIDEALQGSGSTMSGFSLLLEGIPHRFYAWFTLVFVGAIALSGRDFGPMWASERAARQRPAVPEAELARAEGPGWLAAVSVIALVVLTLGVLIADGRAALGDRAAGAALFEVLGAADAYGATFQASLLALALGVSLTLGARVLPPRRALKGLVDGMRPLGEAFLVLYLAWSLSSAVQSTGAAAYLQGLLEGWLAPWLFPSATFLLSSVIAFATGTSYGTMGILMPLVVPLGVTLGAQEPWVLAGATSAVLAGSVLGDHASPISDTTVLSAIGAGSELVEHVRTQLPYVLAVGLISLIFGHLPAGLGVNPWLLLPVGGAACVAVVMLLGRPTE